MSVARALASGEDAATRAALVKDLGTRFEQDSVELAADLLERFDLADSPGRTACASCWPPPDCIRRFSRCGAARTKCCAVSWRRWNAKSGERLEKLVAELGARSFEARLGQPGFPDSFDEELWRNLEEAGLSRLTATEDAGPTEAATVLKGLAAHAAAVPIAETDLLATWLAATAGVSVPDTGPMTVALADAEVHDGRVGGTAHDVPWPRSGAVVLAARTAERPSYRYARRWADCDEPTISRVSLAAPSSSR